jgi:DNA-binding CsgD family transcriptional regulator
VAGTAAKGRSPLLEREPAIEQIGEVLDGVAEGSGRILSISGPAGMGKTRLLWEVRRLAGDRGIKALGARCDELEADVAFGVATQLLTAPLQRATPGERRRLLDGVAGLTAPLLVGSEAPAGGGELPALGDPSQALMRGLSWLVANLAAGGSLALLIDDAQWADADSLRWLNHLQKRLGELPVLIAMTVRSGEPESDAPLLAGLTAARDTVEIEPEPLSDDGAAQLLGARLGTQPSPRLLDEAQRATGGNPLLLDSLAIELIAQNAGSGSAAADLAGRLVPESLVRAVLLRLRRLPEPARAAAEALTILNEAPAAIVTELAGLGAVDGEAALDALERAELIEGSEQLRFTHPIIRGTIYEQISPRRRHARHVQAAAILHLAGERPERIAPHLMAAGDIEVPGGAEILVEAGRRVYALGAPDATVSYLLRALELDPEPGVRAEIQLQLGAASLRSLDGRAVEHLRSAVDAASTTQHRRSALMELARAQLTILDLDGAAETFELAVAESAGDGELELSAIAELSSAELNLSRFDSAAKRLAARRGELTGVTPAERKVLAVAAFAAAQANEPADLVLRLAGQALGDGLLIEEQSCASMIVLELFFALVIADGYELLDPALEAAMEDARARGWPIGFGFASTIRAWSNLRRGAIGEAEADARAADEIRQLHGATPLDPFVSAFLVTALAELGREAEADELLDARCPAEVPDAAVFQLLLLARGERRLARGDRAGGIEDILLVGERELRFGGLTPAAMAWRSTAAVALAAAGEAERALELANEELRLAQGFGADRAIGVALRGLALAGPLSERATLLEGSIAHLERSPAQLELARSLTELGALRRRERHNLEAREPLHRAVDLARECGSRLMERRAADELGASGERAVSAEPSTATAEELTPSELRAARMAASGRSNREIAEDLFVTPRTIEVHLTRAYRKLGIRSRRELADALGGEGP